MLKINTTILISIFLLACTSYGKNNNIYLYAGTPEGFQIKYERILNNIGIGFAPGLVNYIIYKQYFKTFTLYNPHIYVSYYLKYSQHIYIKPDIGIGYIFDKYDPSYYDDQSSKTIDHTIGFTPSINIEFIYSLINFGFKYGSFFGISRGNNQSREYHSDIEYDSYKNYFRSPTHNIGIFIGIRM